MAEVELAEGVAKLPREEWNALVGDGSPFLEWDWLASLEDSGALGRDSGWDPRPLVIREEGRLIAAAPLYLKANSEGEFVFDFSWAEAAQRAGIAYYPKLLVGVPFTPVTGERLLVAADAPPAPASGDGAQAQASGSVAQPDGWRLQLAAALRRFCQDNDLSGTHVNFCSKEEALALGRMGFLTRVGFQYHWHNHGYECFDDYLQKFRSKRRNQIKRERRELRAAGVEIKTFVGSAIPDDLFPPMFQFYLSTIESRYWGRQYLDYSFFELVRDRFRHRLVFIVAFQDGEPIAGTFNVAKGDVMYGRYWGATRSVRFLHFNVCYYAAVEHCIEAGLTRFEPGAGGEYKQLRGFDAQPTYSAHFLADPRLSQAIENFLDQERRQAGETIEWLTEHSALKHTPAVEAAVEATDEPTVEPTGESD